MTEPVELFDLLCPVQAPDPVLVHLAPCSWGEAARPATMCGLSVTTAFSNPNYLKAGCLEYAVHAVEVGIHAFRESRKRVVNLDRFINSHTA